MSGLDVLKHSWGMVWRNKANAARISVVLMIVSIAIGLGMGFLSFATSDPLAGFSLLGPIGDLFINIISLIIGAWIAVAWHRFVLLNETPTGLVPSWHGSEVMLYTLWIFLMMLGFMVVFFPLFVALVPAIDDIEAGAVPNYGGLLVWGIVAPIVMTFAMIVMMRLSTVLVSRALGERLGVKQAWAATRGSNKMIFALFCWLFLFLFVVMIGLGIVMGILGAMGLTILMIGVATPVYAFGGWLFTMLQISIMTTIYGVYVEGRELPYSGGKLA